MNEVSSFNIKKKSISIFFGKLSILSIFIGFYFYLIAEVAFKITSLRPTMLLLGFVFFVISLLFNPKLYFNNQLFIYLCTSIGLLLISSPFWFKSFDVNVYLSAITAIVVINNFGFFLRTFGFFLILTLILVSYEFVTKEYLFIVNRDTVFGYRPLDEKLFGGYSGIFRSKVYFEGPLALSQFAIGAAFLFRNKLKFLFAILIIAIMANGRLGIVVCICIIALYYLRKYSFISILMKPKYIFLVIIAVISIVFLSINLLSENSIERLKEAFNTGNQGNANRIGYWLKGLRTFLDYDWYHYIFGNSGYFESIYKNNSENGWLTLLLDNGIIGFLFYFLPVILISINSIKNRPIDFLYILLLAMCMFVQTFHLGASANLLYWLIIYSFIKEKHHD